MFGESLLPTAYICLNPNSSEGLHPAMTLLSLKALLVPGVFSSWHLEPALSSQWIIVCIS